MEETAHTRTDLTRSWIHFRDSILLVRQYVEPVILIGLLPTLLFQLGTFLAPTRAALGGGICVAAALWLLFSMPALVCLELRAARHEPAPTAELYRQGLPFLVRIVVVTALTGIIAAVGFILLIVPGLIFIRRYILAPYYIVDKNMSVLNAMRESAKESKPVARYVWGSIGVLVATSILAALIGITFSSPPGVGQILTSIVSLLSLFVLPLRYIEVRRAHKVRPSSAS